MSTLTLYVETVNRLHRLGITDHAAQILHLAEEIEIYRQKIRQMQANTAPQDAPATANPVAEWRTGLPPAYPCNCLIVTAEGMVATAIWRPEVQHFRTAPVGYVLSPAAVVCWQPAPKFP